MWCTGSSSSIYLQIILELFLLAVNSDLIGGFSLNVRICLIRFVAFGPLNYNALENSGCCIVFCCLKGMTYLTTQVKLLNSLEWEM